MQLCRNARSRGKRREGCNQVGADGSMQQEWPVFGLSRGARCNQVVADGSMQQDLQGDIALIPDRCNQVRADGSMQLWRTG